MTADAIAIVGASCRFPQAVGLDAFWRLLIDGTDAISEIDPARWATRFYRHPNQAEPGKSYTWSAGLIDGIDLFEPGFFGISPREAAQMDPQQRLLLELVWHAIEDAGIPAAKLAGGATGVYVGASSHDYSDLRLADSAGADSYFMTGNTLSILSNRISYLFDLRGPSLTVDTACSSALVALHHACEAIRGGRIPSAIVGGINLLLAPYPFIGFCRASMLSRRGRCFAFDARADGYVRGEGGGAVVLKRLADAIADDDPIRAVIVGTGVNSDGRTIGLSLPSQTAQSTLLRTVYAEAGVAADDLAFFEMHGTGTPAGDPIEAGAVGAALGQQRAARLPIGSVKTNIGHLEPASGIAGLLKAALALDHRIVPPTLNCATPNPNIPFDRLNLRLVTAAEPLPAGERCYAGVNSFGFGGTNAHVVLAPPPRRPPPQPTAAPLPPLLISARSEAALQTLVRRWDERLTTLPATQAPALLRAAARRRDQHPHRLVALGQTPAELSRVLRLHLDDPAGTEAIAGTAVRDGALAFVFAGNGAQWTGMGGHAYRANAAFRDAIAEVDARIGPVLGWSIAGRLAAGVDTDDLARADIAQPLLFAIQVAIVEVLRSYGIEAAGHVGHSVGEIAAAWAAGALSLDAAARVVVARSRSQQRTAGTGRMAALSLGGEAAADLLDELGSPLEIGAYNTAQSVTVSGPVTAIARLVDEAQRRGIACRALDLDFAFHSAAMDPIRDELVADLADLAARPPNTTLISTVTGAAITAGTLDAEYWWRNIRRPVRFAEAMTRLLDGGYRIFVEIGPHPVLQTYLRDGIRGAESDGRALGTLSRRHEAGDPFPHIAASCHVAGHDFGAAPCFDGPVAPQHLPLYPWQRERFWFEKTVESLDLPTTAYDHPLLGTWRDGATTVWLSHLSGDIVPWIADHAIEGVPVLPAAAIIEMALAAALARRPEASVLEIVDAELRRPLPFDRGRMREIRASLVVADGEWELASRQRLSHEALTVHAVARIVAAGEMRQILAIPEAAPVRDVDAATLYGIAERLGLNYGAQFRTVSRIEIFDDNTASVDLDPAAIGETANSYLIHPAMLDGAFQGLLALLAEHQGRRLEGTSFLPWRFGRVRLCAPFGRTPHRALLHLTRIGTRSAAADIALYDERGAIIAEITECWFRKVELTRRGNAGDCVLRTDLVAFPLGEEAAPAAIAAFGATVAKLAETRSSGRDDQALLIDALAAAAAWPAVSDILAGQPPFSVDALAASGAVAADSVDLLASMLAALERFGAARRHGESWQLEPDNDLPALTEIWRLLLGDAPDLVGELALIAAAAAALPEILAAGPRHAESGLAPMIEHLLQAAPASVIGVDLLGDALAEIATCWPAARPLRILEIGAAEGTARRLLGRLAGSRAALSYLATSPDAEQATRLGFAVAEVPGARARQWEPGVDDPADIGRFDIVVAVSPAARLAFDAATLTALRDRLVPGGLLAAVEPPPNPLWDLVFGQDRRWWRQPDRDGASPLRETQEWRRDLAVAGLVDIGAQRIATAAWPNAVHWGVAPIDPSASVPAAAELRTITLIDHGTAVPTTALRERLVRAGHRIADHADAVDTVLFVAGAESDDELAAVTVQALAALASAATDAAARHATLWVITAGAQQAPDPSDSAADGTGAMVGAALWGFARVLTNEMPRLTLRLLDLPSGCDPRERGDRIAAELAALSDEGEIVWTPAGRHVVRLRRGLPVRWADPNDAVGLTSAPSGGLDSLGWARRSTVPPGPGEIAVDVHAAGINFRDVMWAMGLLPEEALIDGFAGPSFGLECAGIVSAIGADVPDLAIGDRVAGFAPAALGSRVVTAAHAVMPIPDDVGFAEAATVPVAFVTAIYALGTLGQIAAGEHVLVHAAAGGVGLAAIQYAKHRGAVAIATAGSAIKREFLALAGADHVLDSRDAGFADAVRAVTGGRGVDIVLNSLSGEAMEQSLGLLKPFGRFLELGKRDFYQNRRIHLRPMRQNISYFGIDVDQLPVRRPELARALLAEIAASLADGSVRPLAHRVFGFGEIDNAFRLMQASGHIGKLVLTPRGNAGVQVGGTRELALRRDGTYLVTGGITGFGFATARWLAEHGAGTIALLGRRGAETPEAAARIAELAALGATAQLYRGDVADPAALAAVLATIRAELPPLRGVVHAAATIGDGLAGEIDLASALPILRGKLGGAVALDRLTREDPVELFVMFSSATTLLGAPGQGVYVAANAGLDALARRRRAEGLPALAVGWGPIADTGYLAERPEARDALARRLGAKPMPAAQALDGLPALNASGLAAVAFADTSWNEARRYLPVLATPLFAELRTDAATDASDDNLTERLASLAPAEALVLLKTVVTEEAATILRLPAGGIDPQRPLSEIGMDSLMAVELRLALESRLRIDLPLVSLSEGTSVASIATRLAGSVSARPHDGAVLGLVARYEMVDGGGGGSIQPPDDRTDDDAKPAAAE